MTSHVVSVGEDASLAEIASLLERHRIKRVPVVRDGVVIGIVSRANLLRGLASQPTTPARPSASDRVLKERVEAEIRGAGVDSTFINVVVSGGAVYLWGAVLSDQQREAARIAAEVATGGSAKLHNNLSVLTAAERVSLWAQ